MCQFFFYFLKYKPNLLPWSILSNLCTVNSKNYNIIYYKMIEILEIFIISYMFNVTKKKKKKKCWKNLCQLCIVFINVSNVNLLNEINVPQKTCKSKFSMHNHVGKVRLERMKVYSGVLLLFWMAIFYHLFGNSEMGTTNMNIEFWKMFNV